MNDVRKQKEVSNGVGSGECGSTADSAPSNRKLSTGWRDLDEAFASTRRLLNNIKRDHPDLYQQALRRHKRQQSNTD